MAAVADRELYEANVERVSDLPDLWGERDEGALNELIATLVEGDGEAIGEHVLEVLGAGVHVDTVWDAVQVAGANKMFSGVFGYGRHTITSGAAYRRSWRALSDPTERLVHVLQAASVLSVGPGVDAPLDELTATEGAELEDIFAAMPVDSALALGWLEDGGDLPTLLDAWRNDVFLRSEVDFHNYKVLHAVLGEWERLSSSWVHRYVSAALLHAPSSQLSPWGWHDDVEEGLAMALGACEADTGRG